MNSWNRLTNGVREELIKLPVWTTEEDRRRALSYADRHLAATREALEAVHAGRKAPSNLGEIVAVARYENAGWMPDGCFERWRRWIHQETQQMAVGALVQWMDILESDMRLQLSDLEGRMTIQCREQDERVAAAQADARRAHGHLHAHRQKLILARLSVGDTDGARKIARRVPAGSARDQIDNIIHEHAALYSAAAKSSDGPTALPSNAPCREVDHSERLIEVAAASGQIRDGGS